MSQPWAAGQALEPPGTAETTLVEGTSFCISDARGQISTEVVSGLFVRDTRFLARWELAVDARAPRPLGVHHTAPFAVIFVGRVLGAAPDGREATQGAEERHDDARDLVVVRRRYLGEGMREDVSVCNATGSTETVEVSLAVAADFADLFEAKEGRTPTPGHRAARPAR